MSDKQQEKKSVLSAKVMGLKFMQRSQEKVRLPGSFGTKDPACAAAAYAGHPNTTAHLLLVLCSFSWRAQRSA